MGVGLANTKQLMENFIILCINANITLGSETSINQQLYLVSTTIGQYQLANLEQRSYIGPVNSGVSTKVAKNPSNSKIGS